MKLVLGIVFSAARDVAVIFHKVKSQLFLNRHAKLYISPVLCVYFVFCIFHLAHLLMKTKPLFGNSVNISRHCICFLFNSFCWYLFVNIYLIIILSFNGTISTVNNDVIRIT